MKKILGMFSLIAIFTVAFTSQAIANDSHDTPVVYDIGDVNHDYVAVNVELVGEVGVFYVTDETVNCASAEGVYENANLVNSSILISDTDFYIRWKEPICYRNNYKNANTEIYSDVEKPVGWC